MMHILSSACLKDMNHEYMKGGYQFFNSQPLSGGAFFLPKNPSLRSGFLGTWQGDTPCTPVRYHLAGVSNTRSAATKVQASSK